MAGAECATFLCPLICFFFHWPQLHTGIPEAQNKVELCQKGPALYFELILKLSPLAQGTFEVLRPWRNATSVIALHGLGLHVLLLHLTVTFQKNQTTSHK